MRNTIRKAVTAVALAGTVAATATACGHHGTTYNSEGVCVSAVTHIRVPDAQCRPGDSIATDPFVWWYLAGNQIAPAYGRAPSVGTTTKPKGTTKLGGVAKTGGKVVLSKIKSSSSGSSSGSGSKKSSSGSSSSGGSKKSSSGSKSTSGGSKSSSGSSRSGGFSGGKK